VPSVVEQVRATLAASYYRRVPAKILHLESVQSMIAALNDPYTEYLDPVQARLLRQETSRSYYGIGLTVVPVRDGLSVTSTTNGPAREAGIRPGDVRGELRKLERAHAAAIVLDLRGNPGGLLDQAIGVASLFLHRGVVVSVEGAHQHREVYQARGAAAATRLPLVVLVDHDSASAAESSPRRCTTTAARR
jgi:C-terminal processing protease CtpA/Prc